MDTEQPVPVLRREKGPSILQKRVDSSNMEETNVDVCVCVFCFLSRGSCNPGWSQTSYVAEAGIELPYPSTSTSQKLTL